MMFKILLLCSAFGEAASNASADIQISIGISPINIIHDEYLSFNIDPSCNRGFHYTDFTNKNLRSAALYLAPARLRFGGSGADYLTYSFTSGQPECSNIPFAPPPQQPGCDYVTPGCLNSTHLTSLLDLADSATVDFIFGVAFNTTASCLGSSWESSNADRLLTYFASTGRSVWGCELGNEVNNAGCPNSPRQQASAVNEFRQQVLNSTTPNTRLIGPDTGYNNPMPYIAQYLGNITPGILTAVTHHVYLSLERKDFISSDTLSAKLDSALPDIADFVSTVTDSESGAEIWAGEMGPIGGGDDGTCGTNSTCGVFASAIWYADDAALRATSGFTQHNRQDLWGGAYGLVNSLTSIMELGVTDPLLIKPDYYISWLWKRTLGTGVLQAQSSSSAVRAYAFSGRPPSNFASRVYCGSAPQILLLNLASSNITVDLPTPSRVTSYAAWTLAPLGGDPFSAIATLNGSPLPTLLNVEQSNPVNFLGYITIAPILGSLTSPFQLTPYGIAFICLH